jgi:hypothetical protein
MLTKIKNSLKTFINKGHYGLQPVPFDNPLYALAYLFDTNTNLLKLSIMTGFATGIVNSPFKIIGAGDFSEISLCLIGGVAFAFMFGIIHMFFQFMYKIIRMSMCRTVLAIK